MGAIRVIGLTALCVVGPCVTAHAQSVAPAPAAIEGWQVAAYPVFVWVPISIGIDVDVPPDNGDGGGAGDIIDSRFDGAYFGGLTVFNRDWRIEGYGIWAAFGGDRPPSPLLAVDMDLVYGDARLGRRVARDLFLTGGVRRVALKYDITLNDLPHFSRKPGVWDPLVGIGWHRIGRKMEWHASLEGGGFGVGADVDVGAAFRVDWKPISHFGLAAGYNYLYLKISDSVAGRTVIVKPTVQGPSAGFAVYF